MSQTLHEQLINKLKNKNAVIAIIGMGYVGLPLMLRFSEVGYKVIGIDIDPAKVEKLNRGQSYIPHIKPEAVAVARPTEASAPRVDARLHCLEVPPVHMCAPRQHARRYNTQKRNTVVGHLPDSQ